MYKKILVPGAGIGQEILIWKAKEMGLTTVVVSPQGDYPGFEYADIIYHENVRNRERILDIAVKENIQGIVSDQNDIPVETMGYVAEKLNLIGNSFVTCKIYCRKNLMREKCKEIGVPSLDYGIARTLDEAIQIGHNLGYPLICKPTDNQSSRGVFKIGEEEDLKLVFEDALENSFSGQVILEQHMEGSEYIVEGLTIRGDYKCLIVLANENFNLDGLYIPRERISPTNLPEEKAYELVAIDKKINNAFGLQNGFNHNEYLLNPEDGRFYLIDAAARGGGAFISSHLLPYACGFDTAEMLIKLAIGDTLNIKDYPAATKAVCYICFYLEGGKIVSILGLDQIKMMDCVLGVHDVNLKPGKKIDEMKFKSHRLGPVLLGCDTLQELEMAKHMVRNKLIISTDKSADAIIWE